MNRARFLKFCFNVGYRRSIPYKLMNPALKFPKGNKIKIFGCLFSSVFPTLIVVKALSMEKKRGNLIIEADAFYDEAKYEKLYNLLAPHHESDDPEILWRLARAVFEKCRDIKEDKQKLVYLEDALALVDKALEINESCWAAHKWKAILLDYVWRYKSTKNRIVHSFDVRKHMERAIQLNPEDSTSYYLLGEWCFTFADIPWYQRQVAAAIFASPPTSTYEEALHYFEMGEKISPLFYSMNLLMIGKCLLKLNQKEKAVDFLKQARDYPVKTADDRQACAEAEKLLKEIKV